MSDTDESKDIKFSVIIPTLNEEKLVGRVLSQFDNVLKKKYKFEIIISDGGSRDATLSLLNGVVDKLVSHKDGLKENISKGRNKGALKSFGDVLIFLNADTVISNVEKFFDVIERFVVKNDIVALTCPIRVFPEEEKFKDKVFHICYNSYVRFLNKFFMGMGRGECHIVKKSFFHKVNGYDEQLFAGEDFDLFKRLRKYGKIKFISDIIVYESPRRYRKFGYSSVFWDWARNSIWITLFKKSISKDWIEVR
jgi:glycosyltransferase involved in cell wall biosynthesis